MNLSKLYKQAAVYPGFVLMPIVVIGSIIFHQDYIYDEVWSQWELIAIDILFALIYWLIISLSARTIYLNRSQQIRSHALLSALTWFLLPGGLICAVVGKAINEYVTVGSVYEILIALGGSLPFIIGLVSSYIRFKHQLNQEMND